MSFLNSSEVPNSIPLFTLTYCSFRTVPIYVKYSLIELIFLFIDDTFCVDYPPMSFRPQSGYNPSSSIIEGVAPITQRVVPKTAYTKNDCRSFPFSRSSHLSRTLKRDLKTYKNYKNHDLRVASINVPQMNFIPSMPVTVNVDSELLDKFDTLSDMLQKGIDVKHTVDPQLTSVLTQVVQLFASSDPAIKAKVDIVLPNLDYKTLVMLATIVAAGLAHYNSRSKATLTIFLGLISTAVLTQSFLTIPGFLEVAQYISMYVCKYMGNENVPQLNTGEFENIISSFVMMLIAYLSGTSKAGWTKEVVTQLFSYKKNYDSVQSCLTAVVKIIETIISFITRDILGGSSYQFLETNRVDVNELLTKVRNLSDKLHHNKFPATPSNALFVHELWLASQALIAKMPRTSDSGINVALNNASSYLLSIKKTLDGLNLSTNGARVESTAVLFLGAPGVGKSTMMYPLAFELIKAVLPKDREDDFKHSPYTFIYNRQAECVYWDGYSSDAIVCFIDDIGQMRDVAGNPDNEWMNWIRMCSSFNYVLHMASLEKKGNVHFQSRFIIANSNLPRFNIESIVEVEAFKRRVDLCYLVCPKREFCTPETADLGLWARRLDKSTLPIGSEGITDLTPEISEFHELNIMKECNPVATGRVFEYSQISKEILDISFIKEKRFNQAAERITSIINDPSTYTPQMKLPVSSPERNLVYKNADLISEFKQKCYSQKDHNDIILYLMAHHYHLCGFDTTIDVMLDFLFTYYGSDFIAIATADSDMILDFLEGNLFVPLLTIESCHPQIRSTTVLSKLISLLESSYETIAKLISNSTNFVVKHSQSIIEYIKEKSNTLFLVLGILSATGVSYLVLEQLWSKVSAFFTESYSGKPQRDRNTNTKGKKTINTKHFNAKYHSNGPKMSAQAAHKYDQANVDIVNKIVRRNCYELWLPDQECRLGFVTFVRGRVLMMPKHFATLIYNILEEHPQYEEGLVTFKKAGSKMTFQIRMIDMMNILSGDNLETLDCVLVGCPKFVPNHADIIPYFYTRNNIQKQKDLEFRLVLPSIDYFESWSGSAVHVQSEMIICEDSYVLLKGFKYRALTKEGDCGALFTLVNVFSAKEKLVGFHVGGNPSAGQGLSSCITQEDLLECLLDKDIVIQNFESDMIPQSSVVLLDGRFEDMYEAPLPAHAGGKSKIIRSPLYGQWGPANKAPARLNPFKGDDGIKIDPYEVALSSSGHPFIYISEKIVEDIGCMIFNNLEKKSQNDVERRLYSYEEAIGGIRDDPDFGPISRTTSLGYPECAMTGPKMKGKTGILGYDGEYTLGSPACLKIIADCESIERDAQNNIRSFHAYVDTLKDELRSHPKVLLGKTRLFSSCPFRLLILFRRYFGAFILWCHKNRIDNGFAVGVNPFSIEWEMLAQKLLQFGSSSTANIGAGDFKSYDTKERPVIHHDICAQINRWYSDEHSRVREVLFLEIVSAVHIHGSHVFVVHMGNPSGNPLTTLVNNLYNHYCAAYVYYKLHDFSLTSLYTFYSNVYYVTLGDDNAFAVSQSKKHIFNEGTMSIHLEDLGMTYTNELKGVASEKLRNITEISFLKRKFRYESLYDRYAAPLDLETILEIPYWTKDCENPLSIVESNIDTSLRELSLHPVGVFDEWAPKLIKSYKDKCGKYPAVVSRRVLALQCAELATWY